MPVYIALLRGINVGRAKRIAMADLRELVTGLGHTDVRTVLNSGNVIFNSNSTTTSRLARSLYEAIKTKFGFTAQVMVITAANLGAIIRENPLHQVADDPSRFLVAFVSKPSILKEIGTLAKDDFASDQIAIGANAAYLWCAGGILESKLLKAFSKIVGDNATTRNWATVLKLQAAA